MFSARSGSWAGEGAGRGPGGRPHTAAAIAILLTLPCVAAGAGDLITAVKTGDRVAVRAALKQPGSINTREADGSSPLHWAAEADDLEMVQLLLQAGADAKAANRYGVTPLSLAATNRNAAITEALLEAGADPNSALPAGQTVLMTAARTGNPAVVKLLLDHGADVKAKETAYGETALMWACAENHAEAVRLLIEHGAEVNGRSNPLTYDKDRFGLEGVVTILPHGSWTPLMYAARQGASDAVRALAEAGADLNLTDPDGTSALLFAIINGHFDTAAALVEKGADVSLADSAGMTPLYAATDMNTLGEVYGRPSRPTSGKLTALDLVKLLVSRGANPNAQLKSATLQRAHTPGEPTLGEGATALMRAAKNGDSAAIELLLQLGADISLAQRNGTTALMFAAGLGRGVGVFAKDYASDAEMLEAAKVLVAHGADVNAVSAAGQTPMHFAAQAADANFPQPSDDMVHFLAEHGAKTGVKDKQGRTAIDMAMGKGVRGRAGGPVKPRETAAAFLRQIAPETPLANQ